MIRIIKTIMVTIITAIMMGIIMMKIEHSLTAEVIIVVRAFFIPDDDKNKIWCEE